MVASYTYDDAGQLVSMTRGSATYYYQLNGHGDVVSLTDATGQVVNTYRYDPWGKLLSANEGVPNPFRYAGYRYDEATGLYECWMRYYDPGLKRFLTTDKLGGVAESPKTLNRYVYTADDPTSSVDFTGLSLQSLLRCAGRYYEWILLKECTGLVIGCEVTQVVVTTDPALGTDLDGVVETLSEEEAALLAEAQGEQAAAGMEAGAGCPGAAKSGGLSGESAYHYAFSEDRPSLEAAGLLRGETSGMVYATPNGTLSPVQAQIELALSPSGVRDALWRIDLELLAKNGYWIPPVTRVTGGNFGAGGGWEMAFPYDIPARYLTPVR
jgi:RHS repeat-associated protein